MRTQRRRYDRDNNPGFSHFSSYEALKSSEQTINGSFKKTAENAIKLGLAIEAAAAVVALSLCCLKGGSQDPYHKQVQIYVQELEERQHEIKTHQNVRNRPQSGMAIMLPNTLMGYLNGLRLRSEQRFSSYR